MSESNGTAPYLSADFGEQGGRYEWKAHEELVNWISQLQNQWSWIGGLGHQSTNNVWQTIYQNLNPVTSTLQQSFSFISQNNLENADNYLASARITLENFIRQYPWLLPNSAQRRFIEEVRETRHPLEAGLIVASWMNQDLNGAPVRYVINALLQWELYERGIKERMKTESATLKRLAGDMQTTLTQYQEAERTQTKKFDELHEAFINQQTEQQSSFDEIQQHQTESWELHRIAAQSELDTIKNTYDQHMAIAAPVDYWETKRIKHRDMTRISGIAVIVGMISIGSYLSSRVSFILCKRNCLMLRHPFLELDSKPI